MRTFYPAVWERGEASLILAWGRGGRQPGSDHISHETMMLLFCVSFQTDGGASEFMGQADGSSCISTSVWMTVVQAVVD